MKLAAVKTKTASAIAEDFVTLCIYDLPRKTWFHLSVLVKGWSEGSIQQKAKAEVAAGSLRNEKVEEDGAPALLGEVGILAKIVGQGSNSHQNTFYFLVQLHTYHFDSPTFLHPLVEGSATMM